VVSSALENLPIVINALQTGTRAAIDVARASAVIVTTVRFHHLGPRKRTF